MAVPETELVPPAVEISAIAEVEGSESLQANAEATQRIVKTETQAPG